MDMEANDDDDDDDDDKHKQHASIISRHPKTSCNMEFHIFTPIRLQHLADIPDFPPSSTSMML